MKTIALSSAIWRGSAISKKLKEDYEYVWFVDLDTIWFQRLEDVISNPGAFGHVVATLKAAKSMPGGPKTYHKYMMAHYQVAQDDHSWATTPIRFKRGSALLESLIDKLTAHLEHGNQGYNVAMSLLATEVEANGYMDAYVPTPMFAPVKPGLASIQRAASSSIRVVEIRSGAVGMNTYWQSGKSGEAESTMLTRGSYSRIEKGYIN